MISEGYQNVLSAIEVIIAYNSEDADGYFEIVESTQSDALITGLIDTIGIIQKVLAPEIELTELLEKISERVAQGKQ